MMRKVLRLAVAALSGFGSGLLPPIVGSKMWPDFSGEPKFGGIKGARSKYMPHQGRREMARRVRQMAAKGGAA